MMQVGGGGRLLFEVFELSLFLEERWGFGLLSLGGGGEEGEEGEEEGEEDEEEEGEEELFDLGIVSWEKGGG